MPLQHVTVLGFRKVLGTSITLPVEMLNAADLIGRIERNGKARLTIELATATSDPLEMTAGLKLTDTSPLADIQHTDLIIVPALWGNPKGVVLQNKTIIEFLQSQYERGALICGVGTGSFFLA